MTDPMPEPVRPTAEEAPPVPGRVSFGPAYVYNEYKYLVPPRRLGVVRHLLRSGMGEPDAFPEGWVQSIYYDTIDRLSLGQCRSGQGRKIKFRIRRYDRQGEGQLQVKQKDGFAVAKLKLPIPFPDEPPQTWPQAEAHAETDLAEAALGIAALARTATVLRPVIDIAYRRERFRFRDFRVTLDSSISGVPCAGFRAAVTGRVELPIAILEVKTRAEAPMLPAGLRELVSFGSFSKYGVLMRLLLGEVDVSCAFEPY